MVEVKCKGVVKLSASSVNYKRNDCHTIPPPPPPYYSLLFSSSLFYSASSRSDNFENHWPLSQYIKKSASKASNGWKSEKVIMVSYPQIKMVSCLLSHVIIQIILGGSLLTRFSTRIFQTTSCSRKSISKRWGRSFLLSFDVFWSFVLAHCQGSQGPHDNDILKKCAWIAAAPLPLLLRLYFSIWCNFI